MTDSTVLDLLYTKPKDSLELYFDNLTCIPIRYFFSNEEINYLYKIATSIDLSAKLKVKYKLIDNLMKPKGFVRLHAGTNRIVYRHLDYTSFVVKIAIDDVGLQDNPAEFENQKLLKPFVTKTFEVAPTGVLAFSERVEPITSLTSFLLLAPDVYDILVYKILGQFVIDDVGSDYFMNWGVRKGIGPCLLDYPYVYDLDSNKLYCNAPIYPNTTYPLCNGEIDYDLGFNNLVCSKCGKRYIAKNLARDIKNKLIYFKGGVIMEDICKIKIYKDGVLVTKDFDETDTIVKNQNSFGTLCSSAYDDDEPSIKIYKDNTLVAGSKNKQLTTTSNTNDSKITIYKNGKFIAGFNPSSNKPKRVEPKHEMEERRKKFIENYKINNEEKQSDMVPPNNDKIEKDVVEPPNVLSLKEKQTASSVVYDLHSKNEKTEQEKAHEKFFGQGFMAGISEDTVEGIVHGMSIEEKNKREQEFKEANNKGEEEMNNDDELNILENFVPNIEETNNENIVYSSTDEITHTVEENELEFYKWLDSRLDFLFERALNKNENNNEIFNMLVAEVDEQMPAGDANNHISSEEYVTYFIKNRDKTRLTIDVINEERAIKEDATEEEPVNIFDKY